MIENVIILLCVGFFIVLLNWILVDSLVRENKLQQERMVKKFADYMEVNQKCMNLKKK